MRQAEAAQNMIRKGGNRLRKDHATMKESSAGSIPTILHQD